MNTKYRRQLRLQLRRQGFKIYRTKTGAILFAKWLHFYYGCHSWVEKQPAGYITWNKHLQIIINKEIMARGAQKIRERDVKKTIIFKTK
jgi:hypothetical protein